MQSFAGLIPPRIHSVDLSRELDEVGAFNLFRRVLLLHARGVKSVQINFTTLKFAKPSGITSLGCILRYYEQIGLDITMVGMNAKTDANRYLRDCGFFRLFGADDGGDVRSTTIPFQDVCGTNHVQFVHARLRPWLEVDVRLEVDALDTICTCFSEALQNIEHHGGGIGFTMAQHYPKKNIINIAASDIGKGIPDMARTVIPSMSDSEALKKACERGFTSKTNFTNRGFGLDNLIRFVVGRNGGTVVIRSGNAHLEASPAQDSSVHISSTDLPYRYLGSLVLVQLRTDRLDRATGESEAFQWS